MPVDLPTLTRQPTQVILTLTPTPESTQTATPIPVTPTGLPTETPAFTATSSPTLPPSETPFVPLIVDPIGIPMVLVPAGLFVMGRDDYAHNESPAHEVMLKDFYIDQYEVSNAWYADFLNVVGNQFEGNANWIEANDPDLRVREVNGKWTVDEGFENYPMNEMTWFGARAFCEWRGARLPTEAEWEKAARGTDERTFPWGEGITCQMANYSGCFYGSVPVDSYPASLSPYGAYNMAGNMMEWTNDWYAADYYNHSPIENPTGPESGDFRIIRGSSWINAANKLRTTYRFPKLPVLTYKSLGFRCARDVSP